MAVTLDVAVEMGPRNRRRLTRSAIAFGIVAVITLFGIWLSGGLTFLGRAQPALPKEGVIVLIPQRPGMSYGMTPQQLLQRLGKPDKIAGKCWQYPENIKNFASPPQMINAVRLCFAFGMYNGWYKEVDGKWRDPRYGTAVVIPPPTR